MILAGWQGEILDVKGAFFHGQFEEHQQLYMEVPEGFEKFYDPTKYVLLLLATIYGLRNAAMAFWKESSTYVKSMSYQRSKADPCLYFKWTTYGLVLWLSWIDDFFFTGPEEARLQAKKSVTKEFACRKGLNLAVLLKSGTKI